MEARPYVLGLVARSEVSNQPLTSRSSRFIISSTTQDSGKTITSSHLAPIFDEEAQKVAKIAGISKDHVDVAKGYMMAQLSKQWPSDFLTSDLYAQLDNTLPKGKL